MGKIPLVGAILGDWDEEVGPFIVEERMERKLKEKPEVILLKCFSSAQVIFSYDEFNQVSFVIPFLSLGVRAKIYFNLRPDPNVRGGFRPFIFVILLDFEKSIDEHFKLLEIEAEEIQQDYQNGFTLNFDKRINNIKQILERTIPEDYLFNVENIEQKIKAPGKETEKLPDPEKGSVEEKADEADKEVKPKKDTKKTTEPITEAAETTKSTGATKDTDTAKTTKKRKIIGLKKKTNNKTEKPKAKTEAVSSKQVEQEKIEPQSVNSETPYENGKLIDVVPTTIEFTCNLCGKRELLNISKDEIGPLKEIPHKIIIRHDNHSIKVLVDVDYRLIGIHYIANLNTLDDKEAQLRNTKVNRKLFTVRFGPWTEEELRILKDELDKKIPLHIIQLKIKRTRGQIIEQAERHNWEIMEGLEP